MCSFMSVYVNGDSTCVNLEKNMIKTYVGLFFMDKLLMGIMWIFFYVYSLLHLIFIITDPVFQ